MPITKKSTFAPTIYHLKRERMNCAAIYKQKEALIGSGSPERGYILITADVVRGHKKRRKAVPRGTALNEKTAYKTVQYLSALNDIRPYYPTDYVRGYGNTVPFGTIMKSITN